MITRAQAEALLTLAESLEACERLGIAFLVHNNQVVLNHGSGDQSIDGLYAHDIRVALRVDRLRAKGVF